MDPDDLNTLGNELKDEGRYEEAEDAYRRAAEAAPEAGEEAYWNLGIAATALGNWRLARKAWRGYGMDDVPDGDGPIDMRLGVVPIRLTREGDIVLHDGEPTGERQLHGETVSVFNALQLLERSPRSTFEARVRAEAQNDIDALARMGEASGVVIEDWSRSIRTICKACSEGSAHDKHTYEEPPWDAQHRVGLSAVSLEQASSVLMEWASAATSREVMSIA